MKRFMIIGYTTKEGYSHMMAKPKEEQQATMTQWMKWKEKLGDQVIDMGSPLMNGRLLNGEGLNQASVSQVSGYMMLKAESMDLAIKAIKDSPLYSYGPGNSFEILECFDMN